MVGIEKAIQGFEKQPFMSFIGAKLQNIKEGFCSIHLPFSHHLTQQHGLFHGGIIATLADNVAGFAACTHMNLMEEPLTVEFKINLLRPAKGIGLLAEGKIIKNGKTLKVCHSSIYNIASDNTKTLCATAIATIFTYVSSE